MKFSTDGMISVLLGKAGYQCGNGNKAHYSLTLGGKAMEDQEARCRVPPSMAQGAFGH